MINGEEISQHLPLLFCCISGVEYSIFIPVGNVVSWLLLLPSCCYSLLLSPPLTLSLSTRLCLCLERSLYDKVRGMLMVVVLFVFVVVVVLAVTR